MGDIPKNDEYFKKRFINRCNEIGVKYLSHYESETSSTKYRKFNIVYFCEKHGEVNTTWESLRRVKGCKICSIAHEAQSRKMDFQIVKEKFEEMGYELLETEYVSTHHKMKYKCPNHPMECLYTTWDAIRKGHRCRFCYHDRITKHTINDVDKKCVDLNLKLLSTEISHDYKVKYCCKSHPKTINEALIYNIFKGKIMCEFCERDYLSEYYRMDFSEVIKVFEDKGYKLLSDESEYINNQSKLTFVCNKHKEHGEQIKCYSDVRQGKGCSQCGRESFQEKSRKSNDVFLKEVHDLVGNEYTFLEGYEISTTKIKVRHNVCGHVYKVTPAHFLSNRRCPKCKFSKGEFYIDSFLNEQDLDYDTQFKFEDCRNVYPLPFDFVIFNKRKEVVVAIEFQGRQHFEPIDHFGGEEYLEKVILNDKIKKDYCFSKGINLLVINYWEIDMIDDILHEFIETIRKIGVEI